MLCYRCGRIGHRETHCTEPSLVLQDTDKPRANIRGESGLQEPVHNHTPWKTVQTKRPRPRGNQPDTPKRGKPLPRDDPTSYSQAKRTDSTKVQLLQPHAIGSVRMPDFNTLGDPSGITCEDVDTHGETKHLPRPCTPMHSMHVLPSSSCPRPPTLTTTITMQPKAQLPYTNTPKSTLTQTSPPHGSLIGPKLVHPHSNRPRPPSHTHSPKQPKPATHSDHELPHTQSPRTSSGNGSSRIDLEWVLIGMLRRRDGELCSHPGSPSNCNGLEPSDPNTRPANAARTTSSTHSLPDAPDLCSSASDGAPIPGTSQPLPSTTGQATGCPNKLLERGLLGPTARSHFLVSGTWRSKHSTAGERGRAIHNNVLKAKPTICRVRHILGMGRRN